MGQHIATIPWKERRIQWRWRKLPPELHALADEKLAKYLAKPEHQEKLKQGKSWIKGILAAAITTELLYPKDAKWGRRNVQMKANRTKALKRAMGWKPQRRPKGGSAKGSSTVNPIE